MIHPAQRICSSPTHLYYAVGQNILCHDLEKGTTKSIYTAQPLTLLEKSKNLQHRAVLEMTIDGDHLIWLSEDKMLRVLDLKHDTLMSERELVKRGCAISVDNGVIIVGDKFGDVYQYPLVTAGDQQVSQAPLLGHVSMLTCVILKPLTEGTRVLISADRDEHIRVSNFPDGHNIRHFCLGHTQFISSLLVMPEDVLISAGGDDYLAYWDLKSGQQLGTITLAEAVSEAMAKEIDFAVLKLLQIDADIVAVLCDGLDRIYCYNIKTRRQAGHVLLPGSALDMTFSSSKLYVSFDTTREPQNSVIAGYDITCTSGKIETIPLDLKELNGQSCLEVETLLFSPQQTSLLRKKTKNEIAEDKAARQKNDDVQEDKSLKRAIDEDKAATENLMKKIKA